MIETEVDRFRKDKLTATTEERASLRSELRDNKAKIGVVAEMWAHPVGILMRSTLGSDKRGAYLRDLQNSGPVELEIAMRDSVLTGDSDKAAACFSRLDAMDNGTRKLVRISKRDVAEPLVSDDWNKARTFIAITEIAVTEAEVADDEAEGKKIVPQRKIGLGVKKMDLEKVLGLSLNGDAEHSQAGDISA